VTATNSQPSTALTAAGQVLKLLAPISVLTGLLVYFGWVHTAAEARSWGIEASFFDLSTSDYVLRSTNAALVPLADALGLGIAVGVLWRVLGRWVRRRPLTTRRRILAATFAVSGILVVWSIHALPAARRDASTSASVVLMVGAVLLAAAFDCTGIEGRARLVMAALGLVVVGAFTYVTVYAGRTGAERAEQYNREVGHLAHLTIFSDHPLDLPETQGIRQAVLLHPARGPTYRYDCVDLLVRIADMLLVVPSHYAIDGRRQAIYTIDAHSVHVSFTGPAASPAGCAN
jgi:hypothetical protein